MKTKVVAAIAAGTLAVGLLVGAAGAVLVHPGANDYGYGGGMMNGYGGNGGYGMMGGGYGYGMMGGSWSSSDMLNEMRDHMGWAPGSSAASPEASPGAAQ